MTTLARIITGEAGTLAGRQAVLNVIMNRAKANFSGFGPTWIQQATAPNQFSAYPNALGPEDATTEAMIQAAIAGELGNIVPLSFNYANPSIMNRASTPNSWVWKALATGEGVDIGGNIFWANDQGGSPGYDSSKLWKGPTMTDTTTTPAAASASTTKTTTTVATIAGEAAGVVDEIANLEPMIATALNFIPGGSAVAPAVASFAPLILSTASRALHDIASNNNGEIFGAIIELLQHLTPGQPNSATLSKS